MAQGRFISFEGGEGGGKSTQSALLLSALKEAGYSAIHTREPGGEEGAEAIRELLVKGDAERWDSVAETLLFLAARQQHVARVIRPALAAGKWVISDRFHDSTRVYQGIGKNLRDDYYQMLHRMVLGDFKPDLTLLLDMPAGEGVARSLGRDNEETRFESMQMTFHEKVQKGFQALQMQEPQRIQLVDASAPIEEVHRDILSKIKQAFAISLAEQNASL